MIQITPPQNPQYWINQRALIFSENDLENPNRVAVSLVSGTVIMVYQQGVIDYAPDGNFQKWTLKGYSTRLVNNKAHNIYARISRTEKDALIIFSTKNYNIDGSITTDTETSAADENYWYVKIGELTATDGNSNRDLTYDSGALGTKRGDSELSGIHEMFELSKTSTPWLIFVKQMFYEFSVKNPITLLSGFIFKKGDISKPITDIKRSTDSDEDVPVDDETVPTTKYVVERHLSKVEPDETPHHIKLMGGVTTTEAVAEKVVTEEVAFVTQQEDETGGSDKVVKTVNNVKRSVDSNWEVPISDENVTTSAYLEKRIEHLDERYLSKIKPDETPYHIKLLNGLTTTYVESTDYAEGVEKGGWAVKKDIDEHWKAEADKLVARVLGEVYDLIVKNKATFKGSLSSDEFISGFVGGKGWAIRLQEYINAAGENEQKSIAEFDDLIVRGTMRVFEFVVNQMLGENDNRIFTGMMEVDHYDASDGKIYMSTNGGKLYNPFRADDVVIVQQYGGAPSEENDYYVTKQYELHVTNVGIGDISDGEDRLDWITFDDFSSTMEGADLSLITKGDTLVRIDNLYDNNRKGVVQIMSVGQDTPYIDIVHGAKTDPENCVKGRIGNMGGLYSPLFGWLQEFGAYLVNLYAVGEFRIAHTGEDVSDSIEIAKGLFRTNFRQSTYDLTEEDNFFTNASMTNSCEGWTLVADEDEYFTVDDEPEFFNYELMSSYERYAGIAELYGRDMLRLSVAEAVQDNSLIRKPGKHKVFTSTTENEDGSITKNYEEVDDTLYLSVRAYCEASGSLEFGFVDANGVFYSNGFHHSVDLETSEDAYVVLLEGVWDGVGNFTIRSTGDIYIDTLSLTDRPLDNYMITTSTSIEQDAERISLLGKKVNGVEGSVTTLGMELNAAEERITAYVNKEIEGVSASVSQLEIDTEGIKATVAGAQGSADKAQQAADAAQKAADDAAADALKAQGTADANATAIQQNKDSISLVAAAFEDDGNGGYRLTSAAGSVITSEMAQLYAKKSDVDEISGDVKTMQTDITSLSDKIELRALQSEVDKEFGTVKTSIATLETTSAGITTRVATLEDESLTDEDIQDFIKQTDEVFVDLQDDVSEALGFKTNMEKAGLTTTMVEQTKDTINIVSGTFEYDEKTGTYQLASAAGNIIKSDIDSAVSANYATKENVTALMAAKVSFDPDTGKVTSDIILSADQINISGNEVIGIINKGTTTIAASRVDLSGVVSTSALNTTLEGYATDGELSGARAELNESIDNLNKSLTGKIDEKASIESLNSKVNELNDLISGKADSSSLKNVAYVDDATNAALNGATLIVNGYLNTDFITVDTIEAIKGSVGGFTIEETMLIAYSSDNQRSMTLTSDYIHFTDTDGVQSGNTVVHLGTGGEKDENSLEYMLSLSSASGAGIYVSASGIGAQISGFSNSIISSETGSTLVTGLKLRVTNVSGSSYTAKLGDDILTVLPIGITSGSTINITLPSTSSFGSPWPGKILFVKVLVAGYTVKVNGTIRNSDSTETATSYSLSGDSHIFVACSSGWIHYKCN